MTIGVNNRNDAVGAASTAVYPYGFKVFAATDLEVKVRDALNVETTLSYPTHYSVSNVGNKNGGNVTLTSVGGAWQDASGFLQTGYALSIRRVVALTQSTDIRNQGGFFADVHEDEFDKLTMIDQQQQDALDRSFKLPTTEAGSAIKTTLPAASSRANKWFAFDSAGNPIATDAQSASGTTVTSTGSTTARLLATRFSEIYSVKDFGAIGDGVTNDTAAFDAWAARLTVVGGGIGLIPAGTYKVITPKTATGVCRFANCKGLMILGAGAVIADAQVYAGAETGIFFKFTGCNDVHIPPGIKFTAQNIVGNVRGTHIFQFASGCQNLDINIEIDGGLTGVQFYRGSADPDADRSRHYRLNLKASNVEYPVNGQFSGDDGVVFLDCTSCGRNFFYYGCSHLDINVRSKNQQITSVIGTAEGYGVTDCRVRYYDRESTACQNAAPVIQMSFGDSTPATIRDIDIHLNVKCPAGANRWGTTIGFDKLNAGAADVVGRGHRLENLLISGVSEQVANNAQFGRMTAFLFAGGGTPDVIKNLRVQNFVSTGAAIADDWSGLLGVLVDTMIFDNVNYDSAISVANGANGRVIFRNCTATSFLANRMDAAKSYADSGETVVVVNKTDVAAAASVAFAFTADFDLYDFEFRDIIPAVDNGFIYCEVSQDNGGTWKQGANDYEHAQNLNSSAGTNAAGGGAVNDNKIICGPNISNDANATCSGRVRVYNPNGGAKYKLIEYDFSCITTAPNAVRFTGSGYFKLNANGITNIRFLISSGNITSGRVVQKGIRQG